MQEISASLKSLLSSDMNFTSYLTHMGQIFFCISENKSSHHPSRIQSEVYYSIINISKQ